MAVTKVDIDAASGNLNALKSLPGHMDEVVWAFVDWGCEESQFIRATTISVEQDVLFWDVAWSKLQEIPEEEEEAEEVDSQGRPEEPNLHPYWHPRRLSPGHAFRSRVAAYNAAARYNHISALTGSEDGLVHCWSLDIMDHDHLQNVGNLVGHNDQITGLSADWNGRSALSGSHDNTLRLWDLADRRCEGLLLGHRGSIWTMVADWTARKAISTSVDGARIWDVGPRQEALKRGPLATLAVHSGICESLATFSAGSAAFVSRTGSIEFWDLEPCVRMYGLQSHPGTLFAVHLGGQQLNSTMDSRDADFTADSLQPTDELGWMASLTPALAGSCTYGWSRTVL